MTNYDPNLDSRKSVYNKFEILPQIPYSIISYLMDHEELIFKLLKYDSADAWQASKPALTLEEKGLLVYDGIKSINDCRIFMDTGADDAWTVESTQLRISVYDGIPNNMIWGTLSVAFEIYSHFKVNTLSSYAPRNLTIAQRLLEVVNGADIPGVGRLYFDARATSRCRLSLSLGQIPLKGLSLVMATKALG